ncbi:hypothetical protein [Coleofasciculus chthonoplastes]|uniref:hypothetical protein n=1 Tax=Coleofasciculus chthonoplastes TaxID=64178 RepID=UPI003304B200
MFHCDRVRSRLIQCLKDLSSVDIPTITLNPDDTALYQAFIKFSGAVETATTQTKPAFAGAKTLHLLLHLMSFYIINMSNN